MSIVEGKMPEGDVYEMAPVGVAPHHLEPRPPPPQVHMDMIKSLRKEPTLELRELFSEANVQRVKGMVRDDFKRESGYTIDMEAQSTPDVLAILRANWVQSQGSVSEVNTMSVAYMLKQVRSAVSARIAFIDRLSSDLKFLPRGESTSLAGSRARAYDPGLQTAIGRSSP